MDHPEAKALVRHAFDLIEQGRVAEAAKVAAQVVAEFGNASGDEALMVLQLAASCLLIGGRFGHALAVCKKIRARMPAIRDGTLRSSLLITMVPVLRKLGLDDEAFDALQRANADANLPPDLVEVRDYLLAEYFKDTGQLAEALVVLQRSLVLTENVGSPLSRCETFRLLATTLRQLGRPFEAMTAIQESVRATVHIREPYTCCNTFRCLGEILNVLGRQKEAYQAFQQAAAYAQHCQEHMVLCDTAEAIGIWAANNGEWVLCRRRLREARDHLLQAMSQNRHPQGVGRVMGMYGSMFQLGLRACEQIYCDELLEFRDCEEAIWEGVEFVDAAKCVAIREGIQRHVSRPAQSANGPAWEPGPPDWRSVFAPTSGAGSTVARAPVRGLRVDGVPPFANAVGGFALPDQVDDEKNRFCRPVNREGVTTLLPDSDTCLANFYFAANDLVVLPVRKSASGSAEVLHNDTGYFRVPGVLPKVRDLLQRHDAALKEILRLFVSHPDVSVEQLARRVPLAPSLCELYRLLQFDQILDILQPDRCLAKLHLILIPDGPLYRLPLHAICSNLGEPRLYQRLASVRYGLSLRTLDLQQQIQGARAAKELEERLLQGVAFANPDREGAIGFLDGVIREALSLATETPGRWWLHGERVAESTRANFSRRHRSGNIGWTIGHGCSEAELAILGLADELALADGETLRVQEPSLLLLDGLASMSRLLHEGYDFSNWRLFNISACMLGNLRELGGSEVMGYLAALTLLGCRRVCSAMWHLSDESAPEFARHWIRAIARHVFGDAPPGPHAFAIAFREALNNFREADGDRFDHEFFWSAYTLYGLG
jgi:tetratricopeptide (TPR) repeat protein